MVNSHRYASGITAVWSETGDVPGVCRTIADLGGSAEFAAAILFYSPRHVDPQALCTALEQQVPQLVHLGCSSTGEITPGGLQAGGLVAILLPSRWFTVSPCVIEGIDKLGIDAIAERAASHRVAFETGTAQTPGGRPFAVSLIDGLTYAEEAVTAALVRSLGSIPLIGGSAGDDLMFQRTTQILNGRVYTRSALLLLVESRLPFELYTENAFVPTPHKLVVTDSDPERRTVYEFNAEPAATVYANAIGLKADELNATHFASYAVVVRVGGEYFCRSIQQVNEDLSMTFFCAIDNGLVLTLARSEGMVRSTADAMERIAHSLGTIDSMLGFDCIYRKLDARHRNVIGRIEQIYQRHNVIGMNSYGEQFQSMHINQTFTGVAFGSPDSSALTPARIGSV